MEQRENMKALWINDIHLDFLDDRAQRKFFKNLEDKKADYILIAGDIAQGPSVTSCLMKMDSLLNCPIHFVLGNHDYYHGSITEVRTRIREMVRLSHNLHWLNDMAVTALSKNTVLIGHDGWGDGRFGDFHGSHVKLNDFLLIDELSALSRDKLRQKIQALGDEAADHFRVVLPQALLKANHIVVVIHVPPFEQAAWHEGKPSDSNWLPFFACKAAGDVLKEAMMKHPEKRMTVLCGHTHGSGVAKILPNLITYTGAAHYGRPVIQDIFEWE
jgi:predicted phosphodiesterase